MRQQVEARFIYPDDGVSFLNRFFRRAGQRSSLVRALLARAPELVSYFLSFLVIGRFWDAHRVFFRHITVGDYRSSWLNLLVLP
jgi:uncharacterized membrane protein